MQPATHGAGAGRADDAQHFEEILDLLREKFSETSKADEVLTVQPFGYAPEATVSWRVRRCDRIGNADQEALV
jgi:hypothetical protein